MLLISNYICYFLFIYCESKVTSSQVPIYSQESISGPMSFPVVGISGPMSFVEVEYLGDIWN